MKIYNTLAKKKEEFIPREKGKVYMYVCGPTVYNYIHIGNARCYIVFDVIRRFFKFLGYKVKYISNFTDIDDKIINLANEKGVLWSEITEKYTDAFLQDMKCLNVKKADVYPKATEHIKEMIEMVSVLIEKGFGYEVDGNVYFEVDKFKDYGKLSGRSKEDLKAGVRVEIDSSKKNPLDFALWKKAKPDEPNWDSPWGKGRPGWHIECSAMSLKYLNMEFDIHGGGVDLIFPHHENEITQTEAYTGKSPFVKYWMHNGLLTIKSEKMAKSVGNIVSLRELLKEFHPNILRLFYLSNHYKSPVDFTYEKLEEAKKNWMRLENFIDSIGFISDRDSFTAASGKDNLPDREILKKYKKKFIEAMSDDFNTAAALGAIFEEIREINLYIEKFIGKFPKEAKGFFDKAKKETVVLVNVLGIKLGERNNLFSNKVKEELFVFYGELGGKEKWHSENDLMENILNLREEARKKKDWEAADSIRNKLQEIGIEVEDTPYGPRINII
ncbi:MAG: cysteine--tRNA ligase [Actinomycetia bacterium]|nr:cysteine--tRNA ligase [Actinomycetes bacterium]